VNIPDGNKERVQGAVRDIWNYPLFPVSLPVRVVHFFAQNLVNLAVDTGLGPEKGDPAHEQLVAPVRTYGPMVLEAGAFGVGGTVASQMAAEAQAFADAAEAARVYLPGSIDTQPGIYYGNRLITTQDGLAHYWSTGQANLIPGALQKTPNTWYVIHGIQESAIDGADAGWIIKQTLGNPLPVRSVGLDSVNLDIQLITNDPAAVNAWIRAQGAKAVGSVLETPRTPPTP
jgi:hypothetical protein